VGSTGLGVVDFTVAVYFILEFPAARLGASANFGSGFLGPAVAQVVVTMECSGASVTG